MPTRAKRHHKRHLKDRPRRILALDPGLRELGIAVLEGRTLLAYGVQVFPKGHSLPLILRQASRLLRRLIREYQPEVLAMETAPVPSSAFQRLEITLQRVGRRAGLLVSTFAPATIRKVICQDGRASKREVAKVLASQYPGLTLYLTQDTRWKEQHWQNVFDALAVGLAFNEENR